MTSSYLYFQSTYNSAIEITFLLCSFPSVFIILLSNSNTRYQTGITNTEVFRHTRVACRCNNLIQLWVEVMLHGGNEHGPQLRLTKRFHYCFYPLLKYIGRSFKTDNVSFPLITGLCEFLNDYSHLYFLHMFLQQFLKCNRPLDSSTVIVISTMLLFLPLCSISTLLFSCFLSASTAQNIHCTW